MRCHEVKRRLSSGQPLTEEMKHHLSVCESCAQEVTASRVLDYALESGRCQESAPSTPLPLIQARLDGRAAAEASPRTKESRFMAALVAHRRSLSMSLAAAMVVFLIFTLVPFTYKTVIGYQAIVTTDGSAAAPSADDLTRALTELGYGDVTADFERVDGRLTVTLSPLPDFTAAREAAVVYATLAQSSPSTRIEPIYAEVSGSLFAQVVDRIKVNRVTVNGEDLTDKELGEAITKALAKAGITAKVTVTTDEDGLRNLVFEDFDESEIEKLDDCVVDIKLGGDNEQGKSRDVKVYIKTKP